MASPAIGPGAHSRVPGSGDDCRKSHLTTLPLGSSERVRYRCRSCAITAFCAIECQHDRR